MSGTPITSSTLSQGQNVVLKGDVAATASADGYYGVGQIDQILGNGMVRVKLYGSSEQQVPEGGIGQAMATVDAPAQGNVAALPYLTEPQVTDNLLSSNATKLACANLSTANPWGCTSCDPSGVTFDESEWSETHDDVLAKITSTVGGGEGSTRYFIFSCPSQVAKTGQPLSPSNPTCLEPIIASIRKSNGTNRYALVSVPDKYTLQETFLYTYNMPTSPEYFRAVPWSKVPQYQTLYTNMIGKRIVCDAVDNVWLSQAINELLSRGFVLRTEDLSI